jgi:RNA polymerase sigma-70 factor (ECF subfamily)
MRPFRGLGRITGMIGTAALRWEGSLAVDGDVVRLRQGDLDALAELIARYQNRLYRYLLRMVRQPAEAEDLFQQTWLRVVDKIRDFDPARNFDAWLFTLARNLAIDHLRKIRPQSLDEPVCDDPTAETAGDRLPSSEKLPFDRALAAERRSRIAEAVESLPVIYREVLALRFEEGMKIEEIARVAGIPLSTAKTRLRRSLEHLRSLLEVRYPGVDWQ